MLSLVPVVARRLDRVGHRARTRTRGRRADALHNRRNRSARDAECARAERSLYEDTSDRVAAVTQLFGPQGATALRYWPPGGSATTATVVSYLFRRLVRGRRWWHARSRARSRQRVERDERRDVLLRVVGVHRAERHRVVHDRIGTLRQWRGRGRRRGCVLRRELTGQGNGSRRWAPGTWRRNAARKLSDGGAVRQPRQRPLNNLPSVIIGRPSRAPVRP
jgi:hypothetical protein